MFTSLEGQLLVSRPDLHDANFDGTILLVLEHNEDGALGVILNRPSDLDVDEPLPGWSMAAAEPAVVFAGGPVERNAMLALGRSSQGPGDLSMGLCPVDLDAQPSLVMAEGIEQVRLFAGYAGWGGGQLEGELEVGAWWLVKAVIEDVFCDDPSALWARVLRRAGGDLAWYAHVPGDASLN